MRKIPHLMIPQTIALKNIYIYYTYLQKTKCHAASEMQVNLQRIRIGRLYRQILAKNDGNPDIAMNNKFLFTLIHCGMSCNGH